MCFALVAICLGAVAQRDVTKFLGIPVDGTRAEMITKLKAKGFKPDPLDKDVLKGRFNGQDVIVCVVTNGDKVYRIMVADANPQDETNIKIRFNKLCRQFAKNPKYFAFAKDQTIPEDEKIGYNMLVNNKRYEAAFYQNLSEDLDSAFVQKEKVSFLKRKLDLTDEELVNPNEELKYNIEKLSIEYAMDLLSKKSVWFVISKGPYSYDKYYIGMFYDNVYNQADGEDL